MGRYERTDHAITLSYYMKRVLVDTYGFPEGKVSVIPGGVDIDQFKQCLSRAEARQRLELPQNRPIILAVRRLERRMGLHNLVDAMAEVVGSHPDAFLLIAGKGTLRNELDQHIRSADLAAKVRMLGAVSEQVLPVLYRAADFSIVPTTAYEGFGLILVESLASGTPVLGTPQGAIPEVLTPLSASLLLESAAPRHLAEGMLEVLTGKRVLPSIEVCEAYAAANYAGPSSCPRSTPYTAMSLAFSARSDLKREVPQSHKITLSNARPFVCGKRSGGRGENTCQVLPMSRNLGPHERQAPLLPSVVGPHPGGRLGLPRGPRSPSGGVGGECAALGSSGPARDRARAAELPELVATAVE
jgi:hypothetical protein